MTNVAKFNGQTKGEEIANAITHGIGAFLSLAGTVALLVAAFMHSDGPGIFSAFFYGISLISLYTFSTLYHAAAGPGKKILQKLDHCSIFFLILGSYAPLCLVLVGGTAGRALFLANAVCAVSGVVLNCVDIRRFHKRPWPCISSWMVLRLVRRRLCLYRYGGGSLLVAGGLLYSGVYFLCKSQASLYALHLASLVIGGSVAHYFFIFFYTYLNR